MASMRFVPLWLISALLTLPAHADILIGVAEPLTGPNALGGEAGLNSASVAVEQIKAEGGVLGQKLVVTVVDDHCDPKQAVAAANKLVATQVVVVVIGHQCSGAAIPASEIYERAGIIMISEN